jgi:hypothetical protein
MQIHPCHQESSGKAQKQKVQKENSQSSHSGDGDDSPNSLVPALDTAPGTGEEIHGDLHKTSKGSSVRHSKVEVWFIMYVQFREQEVKQECLGG